MKRLSVLLIAALLILSASPTMAEKKADKQAKIDTMAEEVLGDLLDKSEGAAKLFAKAHAYAVFSNLKVAFGFSGGGGKGVAVNKGSGERKYMKMGTGGIGLGLGAQRYNVIFLFETDVPFNNFVEKGWQADAQAHAAAGTEGAGVASTFRNGVAVYQITDKGLIASADIAGTKYWVSKKLN